MSGASPSEWDNGWLHLFRLDDDSGVWRYRWGGSWEGVAAADA